MTTINSKIPKGALAGITTERDVLGRNRFLRIDMFRHGKNELLEDFLDSLEVEKRKNELTIPLNEVIIAERKRRRLEYNV